MEYGADKYYKNLNGKKIICVDFDNTICVDEWPYIGPAIPGAKEVLNKLKENGHILILYTQRSKEYPICCKELEDLCSITHGSNHNCETVDLLTPAIEASPVIFDDINANTKWETNTQDLSRKVFMDYLIDDHVIGTERLEIKNLWGEVCKIVDWFKIDRWCLNEGLYRDSAFKCSYQEYLNDIKNLQEYIIKLFLINN